MYKKNLQIYALSGLSLPKELEDNFKKGLLSLEVIEDKEQQVMVQIQTLQTLKTYACDCELTQEQFKQINDKICQLWTTLL